MRAGRPAPQEEEGLPHPIATELRQLVKLAAPLAAVHAGMQLMSVVDVAVFGRVGAAALGGSGLAAGAYMFLSIFGVGIVLALDPLIAQALGAGEARRASGLLWQGAWLSLAVGVALGALGVGLSPLLAHAGVTPEVAREAGGYLAVRSLGLPAHLLLTSMRAWLQAAGRTRPLVVAMVLGNLLNGALAALFVFGGADLPAWAGPLRVVPPMGAAGAALASVLVTIAQVVLLAPSLGVPRSDGGSRRPNPPELRLAVRVGLPIGLQMSAEVGIFALVGLLAGRLGDQPLAAHNVALTAASLSFTAALGVGAAASTRVGLFVGAGDLAGARRAGFTALGLGMSVMTASALLFRLVPGPIARLLSDEPSVVAAAVPLLAVAAVFQLSDGLQAVGAGVLRGAGDTRFSFLANVAGHWAIGLPVAAWLGLRGEGSVAGLWWGLCAGLTVVGITLAWRFHRLSSRPIVPIALG